MADEDRFQALIGEIYDSALDPERWSATLKHLAAEFGGNAVAMSDKDFRGNCPTFIIQDGFCDEIVKLYTEHYVKTDLRFTIAKDMPTGSIIHEGMFISEAEMDRNEYYQEFLRPFDFRYHLGGALANSDDVIAAVAVQRSPRAGDFDSADVKRLDRLLPHLRRALLIQRRLDSLLRRERMLVEVLDRLPTGVAVLDGRAKPVVMNRMAEAIIAAADGLRSVDDGLAACRPSETDALRKLIATAISDQALMDAHDSILLSRPSGKRSLCVSVTPAGTTLSRELALAGPHVLIFISDPEARARVKLSPTFLQFYSLTRAEARLVEALVNGATPENAQAIFGISMPTVRKHLQAIFGKTGVNRQTDLVRLVLSSPLQF